MKKNIIAICLIFIIIATFSTCFAGCNKRQEGVVRLTEVTHSVFYAPLYIAINNGYFADENITIQLTNGGGADNCMTSLLTGQSDIGLMGPEAAIYVYNEGKQDYPIVFAQLTKKDGSFLMARNKIDNFNWSMLQNKEIIGGRKGGVPAMTLEYALSLAGLTNGTNVTINYDIKFDLIGAAFESGTGDFCTMFEPAASNMQKAGKGHIVASVGKQAGNMPFTAFMASKSYIQKYPTQIEGFTRAIYKAMQFVQNNTAHDIAVALAPSFDGTDIETLATSIQSYKDITAYALTPVMQESDFQKLQTVIIQAKVMTKRADFSKLVDNSFAQKLLVS